MQTHSSDEDDEEPDVVNTNVRSVTPHLITESVNERTPIRTTAEAKDVSRAPTLGDFMTPQRPGHGRSAAAGRYSLGGDNESPQRVSMETKWKIKDLVVPLREEDNEEEQVAESPLARRVAQKTSDEEKQVRFAQLVGYNLMTDDDISGNKGTKEKRAEDA